MYIRRLIDSACVDFKRVFAVYRHGDSLPVAKFDSRDEAVAFIAKGA